MGFATLVLPWVTSQVEQRRPCSRVGPNSYSAPARSVKA